MTAYKHGTKIDNSLKTLFNKEDYPKLTVLDLGCGYGANSIFLAKKNAKVVSVDKDKEALDSIRYQGVKKECIAIEKYKFKKYDLVLALNVLHFLSLKEIRNVVRKILKSLNKDGIFILQTLDSPVVEDINKMLDDFVVYDYRQWVEYDKNPIPHSHSLVKWVIIKSKDK